jgi:GT2 family glycosyltransferase
MPEISVVIPTYKRPQLLVRCLEALAGQTISRENYEVIVVSDGRDEITEQELKNRKVIDKGFRFLQMPFKKGPAAARNFGWRQARAPLIAFTDDDTIPDKDWLKFFLQSYKGEKRIAYSGRIIVPVSAVPTDYEINTAGLETAAFVTANCCCTMASLQEVNGFDERFSMAWREDSDLHFKLLLRGIPIVQLLHAIVVHPVRRAPWGISIKEQKKGMFNALLYKKYPQLYRQKIQTMPPWNYYVMVVAVILFAAGIIAKIGWLSVAGFGCWLFLFTSFIKKRLRHTSKSFEHVAEMIFTSLLIPFIAVYWQLYGAFRYKVFFL